jgi:unsaturated chondroitin disaccharide hydrolase
LLDHKANVAEQNEMKDATGARVASAALFSRGLNSLIHRVYDTVHQIGELFPFHADENGRWFTSENGDWCGGYWVAMLWICYRRTGDVSLRDLALRLTARLALRVNAIDMFRGINHYYSAALGADLLDNESLAKIALRAAEGICAMYNPRARMIPLGSEAQVRGTQVKGDEKGAVDNAMVPLMVVWWAWQRTKRPEFKAVATAVTEQVCNWFIRPDGSTWHVGYFDQANGVLLQRKGILNYSDDSCWSRGQSWLLYGLANGYLHSGNPSFLNSFRRLWDYFSGHVPDDMVPYYDFEDPRQPDVPRDTSAAALASASLFLLPERGLPDSPEFQLSGESLATSLVTKYLTADGRLLHGCFDFPRSVATNNELIWGTYYLMEILDRLAH